MHALAKAGMSQRDIAKRTGWSRPTVAAILKEPDPASVPDHMAPAVIETDAPPSDAPALDQVRWLVSQARAGLESALSVGDRLSAARYTRDCGYLLNALQRLERTAAAEGNIVWHATKAEVAEIEESLRERISAILSRPLLCAECSRALSVSWGTGGETHADPNVNARAR